MSKDTTSAQGGGRQVAGGRWQVAGGRWQVAGGRWQVAGKISLLVNDLQLISMQGR